MNSALFGFSAIDLLAIILYFAGVIYIGWRAMKHVKNQEDYFLGGRRFGKWIQTFAAFGQGTSAESAVTTTTVIGQNGAAGAWMLLAGGIFNLPILWFMARWYRRIRLLTLADFFVDRYNSKKMAGFYAFVQVIFFIIVAGMGFSAMSRTIVAIAEKPESALTEQETAEHAKAVRLDALEERPYETLSDGEKEELKALRLEAPRKEFSYVSERALILFVAVIVLLYAIAGGLEAAFITDMIQGIFILILTVMLIPFGMMRINELNGTSGFLGPFQAMHKELPEALFELWGSPKLIEFTWYYIVAITIVGTVNVICQANQLTATGSAKDDTTAQVGMLTGIFIKRYCTLVWVFIGMMTLVLYGNTVQNPDFIWGMATRDLLGPLGIGLVGLMVACLMAALMSTADALMLTTSALITENIYRPLVSGRSERHYLMAGRVFCVLYIVGGVTVALNSESIFGLFKFMILLNSIVAATIWLGILWRRANWQAAWASMIVTFAFTLFLPALLPLIPGVRGSEYLLKTTQPAPVTRTYIAKTMDVEERAKEIAQWDAKHAVGATATARPEPLVAGESFEKTFKLPEKSLFWQGGVKKVNGEREGVLRGEGLLKVELVALNLSGWDLSKNSHAFNETIAILLRLIVPFGVFIVVALCTKPHKGEELDQFYGKLRTPANPDHDLDAEEMALTREDPHRFDHVKLFPGSNWEFNRWTPLDLRAVIACVCGTSLIIVLLITMVRLGQ